MNVCGYGSLHCMNLPTRPDHNIELERTTILGQSGEMWQGTFYACPRPECLQRYNVEAREYFRIIEESQPDSARK